MTRVIICEDDPMLSLDLEHAIQDAGGHVCGAFASAEDALKFAEQERPELAIIDLNLADGATGVSVAAQMDKLGCKVVIISGGDRDDSKIFAIRHTFISKPVPSHVIADLLRTHCAALTPEPAAA
jgi:DNA-binding NarL/FixJ family response regulator